HWPAALPGDRLESLVGIGGDRPGHLFEQGEVVDRVAVEGRHGEVVPRVAELCQPLVDPGDLAFAKRWRAGAAAGDAALDFFDPRPDEVLDAEGAGDRAGHELVG